MDYISVLIHMYPPHAYILHTILLPSFTQNTKQPSRRSSLSFSSSFRTFNEIHKQWSSEKENNFVKIILLKSRKLNEGRKFQTTLYAWEKWAGRGKTVKFLLWRGFEMKKKARNWISSKENFQSAWESDWTKCEWKLEWNTIFLSDEDLREMSRRKRTILNSRRREKVAKIFIFDFHISKKQVFSTFFPWHRTLCCSPFFFGWRKKTQKFEGKRHK